MDHRYKKFKDRPVAYFCAEYALFDHTPLYAGGLGILAGDYISEIIEQKFPAVAIGLFYHKEHQYGLELSREKINPSDLGLSLAKGRNGKNIRVPIMFGARMIFAQVWQYKNVFLLDTQVEENAAEDWTVCDTLYVENRDTRLMQEIVLGIGGMKLLEMLEIKPSLYHLNEGHSAFMVFELIKCEMIDRKIDFKTACEFAKKCVVFTNHTLVQAGQELFDPIAVKNIISGFIDKAGIRADDLLGLGLDKKINMFSMTNLALNMSSKVNAVSKMHGKIAADIWKGYEIEEITNGINFERWDILKYYSQKESKKKLIDMIKDKCGVQFDENILLIGWARRFVEYKRPLAILGNIRRFKEIALRENKKVQIVFSSTINKNYLDENHFFKELDNLIKNDNELKDIITFIPNYNIDIAKSMVSGCDIWLNTPIVGQEACGTSGMKACLNGVLPFTTNDGWINEVDLNQIGWVVEDDNITENLLDVLENKIIPEYYNNKEGWKNRIKKSRNMILENFSTKRMLDEYIDKLYLPLLNE